jgi:hypothetical protein
MTPASDTRQLGCVFEWRSAGPKESPRSRWRNRRDNRRKTPTAQEFGMALPRPTALSDSERGLPAGEASPECRGRARKPQECASRKPVARRVLLRCRLAGSRASRGVHSACEGLALFGAASKRADVPVEHPGELVRSSGALRAPQLDSLGFWESRHVGEHSPVFVEGGPGRFWS